jgi:hypothetical protein
MDWIAFLHDSFFGSVDILKKMVSIIFPLFIGIEIIDHFGILQKVSRLFEGVLGIFNLPKEASLPIIIAQSFGLLFGAGLILRATEENNLKPEELMTISVFFALCHAVFEDTLLFTAIGGNGAIILGSRILFAVVVTYIYSQYRKSNRDEGYSKQEIGLEKQTNN